MEATAQEAVALQLEGPPRAGGQWSWARQHGFRQPQNGPSLVRSPTFDANLIDPDVPLYGGDALDVLRELPEPETIE